MSSAEKDAHCGGVHTLALCGSHLCSAGGDAMIRIWDSTTLTRSRSAFCSSLPPLHTFARPLVTCHAKLQYFTGRATTIVGHGKHLRTFLTVDDDSCHGGCRVLRGHRGSVLTLYSTGSLLLSGGRDNVIRVWVRMFSNAAPGE